ncbi:uncharacterized protein LOC117148847 [Drosophila mauritiana]|uniref:Uncharacterized protein LOC117148847 n=1 Tax=Drosophila mauritiana TaxID=7226 RepID=A0A6P8L2R9_DROMA|nr:uncharacterized protein LOC117148847 [Drosophila mauritiana]
MSNLCWLLAVPMAILPLGCAIVGAGRDLLLTPRQGHQLSGKRIFYEEPAEERVLNQRRSQSARPWERTLKHVTYVTLFTDAAMGAAAGNLSQLHEYHDFLQAPYAPADDQRGGAATGGAPSARFGDIMTLAKGYLEQLPGPGNASSYRFVEGGTCYQLNCPNSNPKQRRALWQVQRIRHRDGDKGRHYHYEMKFSVTPLDHKAWQPHHQQMSYIQKESDYPASFGRLAHDQGFAQRRQDRERYGAAAGGSGGNAEQSQATFVHGIFQPAPPPKLNIGEYLKGAVAQGGPKIELFPGLLNLGLRPNYVVPTTFRPSYPAALKFDTHPELERFPTHNGELGKAGNAGPAVPGDLAGISGAVTHHFHHHFYVAPGAGDAQLHPELGYRLPNSSPQEPITPASNLYTHHQTVQFPSSNSGSSESLEEQEQDLLLRTPQIYGQASKYQTAKLPPLLIYAGGSSGDEDKSFVQSEPLEETVYRYSEPDPLYVHQNPIDVLQDKQPPEEETDRGQHQELASDQKRGEQRPVVSLEQPELSTTAAATTAATPSPSAGTTTETASTERSTPVIPTTSASFVSTSTHFSPLRTISRYRTTPKITAGRSTTTTTSTSTEPPLNKWAKRRKEHDSKAKSSHRHEAFVSTTSSTSTTSTTTSTTPPPSSTTAPSTRVPLAPPLPPAPPSKEVVEVLTQKSVSRSVSIKVGENGEEIPIIVDDEENEVKPVLTN